MIKLIIPKKLEINKRINVAAAAIAKIYNPLYVVLEKKYLYFHQIYTT